MAGFADMSGMTKGLVIALVVFLLAGVAWYLIVKPMNEENTQKQAKVTAKEDENKQLREYEPKLADMNRQIASLQQQLEIQKTIVPDSKEVDQFVHVMQDTAAGAGVEVRRYTSKPVAGKEFYSEVPFEMDIDGPYYSVVNFFEKVSRLQRIINVESLQMANTKRWSEARVKNTYTYAPSETVVASFTAKTFFSAPPAAAAQAKAPGIR